MNTNYNVRDCVLMDIPTFTDERGAISVMDKELPFKVKRVFWLHHISEGKHRGAHALLEGMEMMVAIHGSFVVDLEDGTSKISVLLNDPSKGLMVRPGIWFSVHSYKKDGVSLLLSDEEYRKEKYINDYDEYISIRKKNP